MGLRAPLRLILVIPLLLLAGCFDGEQQTTIGADGSGSVMLALISSPLFADALKQQIIFPGGTVRNVLSEQGARHEESLAFTSLGALTLADEEIIIRPGGDARDPFAAEYVHRFAPLRRDPLSALMLAGHHLRTRANLPGPVTQASPALLGGFELPPAVEGNSVSWSVPLDRLLAASQESLEFRAAYRSPVRITTEVRTRRYVKPPPVPAPPKPLPCQKTVFDFSGKAIGEAEIAAAAAYAERAYSDVSPEERAQEETVLLQGGVEKDFADTQIKVGKTCDRQGNLLYILSFRGTEFKEQLVKDFLRTDLQGIAAVAIPPLKGKIHAGFSITQSNCEALLYENRREVLQDFRQGKARLLLTGHSLGGAAATLFCAYLTEQAPGRAGNLRCITFGAPAVGNQEFAAAYDGAFPLLRAVNAADLVPYITWPAGYRHFGLLYGMRDGKYFEGEGWDKAVRAELLEAALPELNLLDPLQALDYFSRWRERHSMSLYRRNIDRILGGKPAASE